MERLVRSTCPPAERCFPELADSAAGWVVEMAVVVAIAAELVAAHAAVGIAVEWVAAGQAIVETAILVVQHAMQLAHAA